MSHCCVVAPLQRTRYGFQKTTDRNRLFEGRLGLRAAVGDDERHVVRLLVGEFPEDFVQDGSWKIRKGNTKAIVGVLEHVDETPVAKLVAFGLYSFDHAVGEGDKGVPGSDRGFSDFRQELIEEAECGGRAGEAVDGAVAPKQNGRRMPAVDVPKSTPRFIVDAQKKCRVVIRLSRLEELAVGLREKLG